MRGFERPDPNPYRENDMTKLNGFFAASLETLGGFLVVLALVAAMNSGAKAQLPPRNTCVNDDSQSLCNVDCIGSTWTTTIPCETL